MQINYIFFIKNRIIIFRYSFLYANTSRQYAYIYRLAPVAIIAPINPSFRLEEVKGGFSGSKPPVY